ncbi:sugar ABC transporter permease, partial [Methanomassiliicoccales archaeon RumEn M1]
MKLSPAARREENWGWIMVAPTILGLVILNLWPFVQTVYTSFCEHLGFGHYKFIGLGNYAEIFQTPEVWRATWNTILFCILTVPVGLFLSLLVAMLLNAKIKFKGGFRTI